jgi:DALR anticodon binding domain
MNCSLHKITYFTFRTLLLDRIAQSLYLKEEVGVTKVLINQDAEVDGRGEGNLRRESIPLRQVKSHTSLVSYQSAIALKQTSGSLREAARLAYQIGERFRMTIDEVATTPLEVPQLILSEFTVIATEQGWLEFKGSDRGFAIWLQFFIQKSRQMRHLSQKKDWAADASSELNEAKFTCQYIHARCCALLRLGQEAGWLEALAEEISAFWLEEQPRWVHPNERNLIGQAIAICDQLYGPPATQSHPSDWQMAIALSQSFQSFHRTCRIFGEPIALSHARLALIWMTQILLKALLEERLGVFAPPEL